MSTPSMDSDLSHVICEKFDITCMKTFQHECIMYLLQRSHIILCQKTGSGKSLAYEAFPIAWLLQANSNYAGIIVIVIEPLLSIMEEQVQHLCKLGYSSTYIGRDNNDSERIKCGEFTFVFASPESLVGNAEWRNMLRNDIFQQSDILLVIDEAHTVIEWFVFCT